MKRHEIIDGETALLAEFNHRLFNTFQIIAAAVHQCRRDLTSLVDLESRLVALGRLHRLLSRAAPRTGFEDHCRSLCGLLVQAFGRDDVTPCVVMEDLLLTPEQAYRLPLLVVELVTNVLKHSLKDQADGTIWIDLRVRGVSAPA